MLDKLNNLEEILDQLVEFTGKLFEIKIDGNLQIPAFSLIENDFRGNPRNTILINDRLIPMNNKSILAHILAHEYGHHIYEHVKINPSYLSAKQLEHIENEADFHALMFIEKYNYNKDEIIKFIADTSVNKEISRTRIDILCGNIGIIEEKIDILGY
jgi:hypothetical protein|tara:strand:- start:265 stop:735 length:471 start_codon:yes stop_codon:yes gene_type:complete